MTSTPTHYEIQVAEEFAFLLLRKARDKYKPETFDGTEELDRVRANEAVAELVKRGKLMKERE